MKKKIDAVILFAVALMVLASGLISPKYNWDIIGYVASAYSYDGLQGAELSQLVYADIKREVGPDKFDSLIDGDYQKTVYTDPDSLSQHLPFYKIRVAYVQGMRGLHNFGVSYPKATFIISAFFASFSVFLLGALCRVGNVSIKWVPFIVLLCGYGSLARLSTPDAMACFVSLWALYSCVYRKSIFYFIVILIPLVRTDYVILSLILCLHAFFRGERLISLAASLVALGIYFSINYYCNNYGWLAIFNFSLIGLDPYPKYIRISKDISLYTLAYLNGFKDLLKHRDIIIYVPALLIFVFMDGYKTLSNELRVALRIAVSFMVSHMLLFPAYENRFFIFSLSIFVISCLSFVASRKLRWV